MNLYLVRHTKVDYPKGICYGQTDADVLPSFKSERISIAEKLKEVKFNSIYSSPLKRCKKLAEYLAKDIQTILFDPRLMELNFGIWEGKAWDEIEKLPEADKWFANYFDVPCPNGESYKDLLNRAQSFLLEISGSEDENILIVCHGGTMRAISTLVNSGKPQEAFDLIIDPGEILHLKYDKKIK